ncbi:MAG: hypothetical protein IJW25_02265, partial [Clostridia bacterium]|nr:hypothetical protein [Clostridia bacterium]
MAIAYGMTLSDSISQLELVAAGEGMYASAGIPNEDGGSYFEIYSDYVSRPFVLLLLGEGETLTVNFSLEIVTGLDPLIYTLLTDSTTNEQSYALAGTRGDIETLTVPATYKD